MPKLKDIVKILELWAPPALQETYDNSQLQTGNLNQEIRKILVALDCTEQLVDEALQTGAGLIITHHPIIFKGLKSLTGKNYVERALIKAIKNDIAIYAIHTNLDSIAQGVSFTMAHALQLSNIKILSPKVGLFKKIVTFAPKAHAQNVIKALAQAGAGQIGNYSDCSFTVDGTGTFKGNSHSNPTVGQPNHLEVAPEQRIEMVIPSWLQHNITQALYQSHPYEEPAFYIHPADNLVNHYGFGAIGFLDKPMKTNDFFAFVKKIFKLKVIRTAKGHQKEVHKIAVCGGAGVSLTKTAIAQKADVFITSDVKYHDFFETENKLWLADIGHYESEKLTENLIAEKISENFSNIAVTLTKLSTNPIEYL